MKKILALVLVLAMVLALAPAVAMAAPAEKTIKFGLITLHDENSTYDGNFINAAYEAVENLKAEGIEVELVIKTGFEEDQTCYEAACDLAEEGCDIVMADSFGHEPYLLQAAKEYPEVQFLHATGTMAHTEGVANFHDAFAAIYEGRYLAGVAAGLKLQEMIDNGVLTEANYDENGNVLVGYVGAFTYAEVVSGYTSWFLGVRSVVENVAMKVSFTGSWYAPDAEMEAANNLINNGCALISQHADSMGAPNACKEAGVPNVTYNVSTENECSGSYICYSRINWAPYYEFAIKAVLAGEEIPADYVGTIATGSVEFGLYGAAAAEGTEEYVNAVKEKIVSGELHVFDCSTFTVEGETLTSFMADVDTDAAYTPDHEVVMDGYVAESGEGFRSAPYFNLNIDGIEMLNVAF